MARKRSSRTKRKYSKKNTSKKNKSKSRKRSYRKKGGMEGWQGSQFPPGSNLSKELNESMGVQNPSFQEQAPYGPLSECQTLECKKRRAEIALETAKEELEKTLIELNDARDRERLGVQGKKAIGKTVAKTAKKAAALASAKLSLTPENRGDLLKFQQSAERFDRSLDD